VRERDVNRERVRGTLLALVTVVLLSACGSEREESENRRAAAPRVATSDTLRSSVLFDGDALGRPQSVGVVGEWLLVGDIPRPRALHVLHRQDGRHLASWGGEGGGPGEFRRLWSIQPASGRGAWLYDPAQSRLTLVDIPALVAGGRDPVRKMVRLEADLVPMTAQWLSDTVLVSSGMFARGRLALFDAGGRLKRTAGPLPPAREGVPAEVAQHAYTGWRSRPAMRTGWRSITPTGGR
jgi:hypothetical protein